MAIKLLGWKASMFLFMYTVEGNSRFYCNPLCTVSLALIWCRWTLKFSIAKSSLFIRELNCFLQSTALDLLKVIDTCQGNDGLETTQNPRIIIKPCLHSKKVKSRAFLITYSDSSKKSQTLLATKIWSQITLN